MSNHAELLKKALQERIVIIDGAMGTTIRTYGLGEKEIRGERFADSKKDLKNNGDLYSLTQAATIGDIHRRFLEAGADIIETNTFSATSIGQSEFFVDDPRMQGRGVLPYPPVEGSVVISAGCTSVGATHIIN